MADILPVLDSLLRCAEAAVHDLAISLVRRCGLVGLVPCTLARTAVGPLDRRVYNRALRSVTRRKCLGTLVRHRENCRRHHRYPTHYRALGCSGRQRRFPELGIPLGQRPVRLPAVAERSAGLCAVVALGSRSDRFCGTVHRLVVPISLSFPQSA